jgi:hypothetical protein
MRAAGHTGARSVDSVRDERLDALVDAGLRYLDHVRSAQDACLEQALAYAVPQSQLMHQALAGDPRLVAHPMFGTCIGYYMTALNEKLRDKIITYDLAVPVSFLGVESGKFNVNVGIAGMCFGYQAKGISINNGTAGNNFASDSTGININLGTCGSRFASQASSLSLNINYGRTGEQIFGMGIERSDGKDIVVHDYIKIRLPRRQGREECVLRDPPTNRSLALPVAQEYRRVFDDIKLYATDVDPFNLRGAVSHLVRMLSEVQR